MISRAHTRRLLLLPALFAALFACVLCWRPADASAQCALCRTALEQGGADTAKAMNYGIIVLLIPPVAIFCTIFAVAVRQQRDDDKD